MRDLLNLFETPLMEGGNVFKTPTGEEATQRISTADVPHTVAYLEKITGLDFTADKDEEGNPLKWLGTTGRKKSEEEPNTFELNSSGDLDLSVDINEKPALLKRLMTWAQSQTFVDPNDIIVKGKKRTGWIKDAGTQVNFKAPINGDPKQGFVQADFMFADSMEFQQFAMRGEPAPYKGMHRHIIMNSVAKTKGMKWSYLNGLIDMSGNPVDGGKDLKKIINTITPGWSGNPMNWHIADIFAHYQGKSPQELERLFGEADKTLQHYGVNIPLLHQDVNENALDDIDFLAKLRDRIVNQGMQMIIEGVRIEHPEDLPIEYGSNGLRQAINSLTNIRSNSSNITIKWDGIPAIIFGRKPTGEFVLTDKSGFTAKGYDGKATSPKMLADIMNSRKGGGREDLIKIYQKLWPLLEGAVPAGFKGYVMGDLLYHTRPDISNGSYVFTPNTVTYEVDAKSDIGRAMGKSTAAVAIHTYVDQEGGKTPLNKAPEQIQHSPGVLFLDPYFDEEPKLEISPQVKKALNNISKYGPQIDSFINLAEFKRRKISNMPVIIKKYINSLVTAGSFDTLGSGFVDWLKQSGQSENKIRNMIDYVNENKQGFQAVIKAFTVIMKAKDHVIQQLDQQAGPVRAHINGTHGHEGYVLDSPDGQAKFVDRMRFSQANFNKER